MSLIQKTLLIIGTTLAALTAILYFISSSIAGRTELIILFFLIVGIVFLVLSAALLGQFVIFPLTRLESCVRKIRECTSLTVRVPARGRDEIARLGRAINEMLDEVEKSCNQVKKSEELLRHSQKMEAVGRLAGGVAHDFNNLLTAIIGYSDLVLKSLPSDSPQRKDVEEIRKAGERATILTHQLLAFGRKQMFEPRVLDLNQVVLDMHKMLSRLMGEDVEIETILAKNLWPVRADLTQIEQAILNLAINARDAMPDGGKLIFETTNTRLDENYALRRPEVSPGDFVMLAVSDTGVGMNSEVRTHLFEPFFTTKVKEKRTGLGLSTVYGIVKQSGGSIFAYSEPGLGTTLKIYLPRVEEEARVEGVGKPLAQAARGGKETILLVEDEEMVRRLTCEVLQREGYTVLEASNGPEALQIFERDKGAIQVLLTDVVMPRMNGYELAERLVKSHPQIKVVYMSGYTDQDIISQEVVKKGAGFIQKPFTPEILTRKLREALERR